MHDIKIFRDLFIGLKHIPIITKKVNKLIQLYHDSNRFQPGR